MPLIPRAIDIAHLVFEQILIKENRIKTGEYDREKGAKGIFVSKFRIWDPTHGFNLEGIAFGSTPEIQELEKKINEIKDLLESLGLYDSAPFPDENLRAQIDIENMPFSSGVFSVSLRIQRYRDREYHGNIYVSFEDSVDNPEEAIRFIETAVRRNPKYYSAFIGYGQPDVKFAMKLVMDLRAKNIDCWLYSLDHTAGERTWKEIVLRRRKAERMIVLCSANSLIRDGLLKELEEQIDEDPDKIIPISLDNLWKEEGFLVMRAGHDLKPFLKERNYADFKNESIYVESLNKLLTALQRKD